MAGEPLQVEIEEGVAFGTGGDRELLCDIYRPQGLTEPAIGVLMLFGQGWVAGERSQLRGYGILLGRLLKEHLANKCETVKEALLAEAARGDRPGG